jgi:hypothetical protein
MTTPTSIDFRTNSSSVSSEKLDKTVSSQVAGSDGVARFSIAGTHLESDSPPRSKSIVTGIREGKGDGGVLW